jgi:DNA-binding LacI/PurR family transcriptional regulator
MEGDWSSKSGYLATKEILKTRAVTAIFSGNDEMALGAYRAIHEARMSIPGDICLVGFDDIPTSSYFARSLTTIRQDFDQCGHAAITVLTKMVRREKLQAKKIFVAPELIVRKSTAKPLRK